MRGLNRIHSEGIVKKGVARTELANNKGVNAFFKAGCGNGAGATGRGGQRDCEDDAMTVTCVGI